MGFLIPLPQEPVQHTGAVGHTSELSAGTDFVSPGFFDTLEIERLAGRDFSWHDDATAPAVVIVNSILANRLFPQGAAIGRHISIGRGDAAVRCEIVGIVADAPVFGIRLVHVPIAFRPLLQSTVVTARVPTAIVRATGNLDTVASSYKLVLGSARFHFLRDVQTLDDVVDEGLQQERLAAWGASLFAAVAVMLAALGIYGLVAYTTARRTHEIGVRMALGARRASILAMITQQGLAPTWGGIAVGTVGAIVAGRLARSMLYGIQPYDLVSIAGAAGLFAAIAAIASALPAYRASRLDPMHALREE